MPVTDLVKEKELALAQTLIQSLAAPFEPEKYKRHAARAHGRDDREESCRPADYSRSKSRSARPLWWTSRKRCKRALPH